MKKFICFLILLMPLLGGCQDKEAIKLANESTFSVEFMVINNEVNTAKFNVSGLPNQEEFDQIKTVILDSMNAQKYNKAVDYKIDVYSSLQDPTTAPLFGNVTFKDGVVTGDLTNITIDKYIELSKLAPQDKEKK